MLHRARPRLDKAQEGADVAQREILVVGQRLAGALGAPRLLEDVRSDALPLPRVAVQRAPVSKGLPDRDDHRGANDASTPGFARVHLCNA
eukprot:146240-Prymnesium_polylepis.1